MSTVLVQLTDTHIGPSADSLVHGADTAANFRRVARTVREMQLEPAAVLLTGDLSDRGEPESYRHLRTLVADELEPIGCPILPVLGNHDHRASFREAYLGEPGADDDTPFHYAADVGAGADGVRIVMCDSYVAGSVTGRLGDQQLSWLDEQLAGAQGRAGVVALHHPSVPRGVPRRDDFLLEDRDAFGEVLAAHDVAAVLCGHSHVSTASRFAGVLHAAAPATAFLLDPSTRDGPRGYRGAGFAICTFRGGRAVVNPYVLPDAGVELFA